MLQGHLVTFITGLCVLDTKTNSYQVDIVPTHVQFRSLTDMQIERYLQKEKPYFCTGSSKIEGLGITLIQKIQTDDYTSLIGLPLMRLTEMLQHYGITLP
jgi:septum formation protein